MEDCLDETENNRKEITTFVEQNYKYGKESNKRKGNRGNPMGIGE
jgi:hypothetical protein